MVIRTSFGARRGLEAHADTKKMQKPNQGSEKKRAGPEIRVFGAKLWRSASFVVKFRTKMGFRIG
jgi:hypothetical protein